MRSTTWSLPQTTDISISASGSLCVSLSYLSPYKGILGNCERTHCRVARTEMSMIVEKEELLECSILYECEDIIKGCEF